MSCEVSRTPTSRLRTSTSRPHDLRFGSHPLRPTGLSRVGPRTPSRTNSVDARGDATSWPPIADDRFTVRGRSSEGQTVVGSWVGGTGHARAPELQSIGPSVTRSPHHVEHSWSHGGRPLLVRGCPRHASGQATAMSCSLRRRRLSPDWQAPPGRHPGRVCPQVCAHLGTSLAAPALWAQSAVI